MSSLDFTCAEGLPIFKGFDDCNPEFGFGEIEFLIVAPLAIESNPGAFTGWDGFNPSVEAEWDDLFAETDSDTGEQTAYLIPVRGTLGEPDRPEIEASRYRKAYPDPTWSLEFKVDDLSDSVYEAMRQFANTTCRVWFVSGDYIFGGNTGCVPATVNTWLVIEEGRDSMHNFHGVAEWRAATAPERDASPYAETSS